MAGLVVLAGCSGRGEIIPTPSPAPDTPTTVEAGLDVAPGRTEEEVTTTTTTEPEPEPTTTTHTHAPRQAVTTTAPELLRVQTTNDIWWSLALCEDGGRNRDFGPYSGYFHFLPSTYHAYGGIGQPSHNSYEVQLAVAKRLQATEGWWPWPGCKAKLGL